LLRVVGAAKVAALSRKYHQRETLKPWLYRA
jgi:hypothetical protein